MTPLMRSFDSLEFIEDISAYWHLPSGHQLVVMYEWHDRDDGGIEWRCTYDVDVRGHGQIDLTACPLYNKYDRGSFSNMSSTDVVNLATWIEKYAAAVLCIAHKKNYTVFPFQDCELLTVHKHEE